MDAMHCAATFVISGMGICPGVSCSCRGAKSFAELETSQEVNKGGVHLRRALLLDPVAAAVE
jgi:hypothetical protein